MSTISEYKLVKGEFNPDEAKDIVNSLINSKINFHNLKDFSENIRFNNDPSLSKKRIEELIELKKRINDLILVATKENSTLEINCNIEIKLKENV